MRLTVNGRSHQVWLEPRVALADLLRDGLGLTGTNLGCEHGVCGSCTVVLDGRPVRSCLVLAVQCEDSTVTTVEGQGGTAEDGTSTMHPVQQAFHDEHALQCGFCTPGFLVLIAHLGGPDARVAAGALMEGDSYGFERTGHDHGDQPGSAQPRGALRGRPRARGALLHRGVRDERRRP